MRKSKIVGFSVPPEVYDQFEKMSSSSHKTKSEMFRQLIDGHFQASEKVIQSPSENNLAQILKTYWELKSKSPLIINIIGLGIIVNEKGQVLIGSRKEKDPVVKNLTWVFPGGKLDSLNFAEELKNKLKGETSLKVEVKTLVSSRIHPDAGLSNTQIIALYFYCQPVKFQTIKPGGDLKKLLWVKPTNVFKYFTTSTSDEVTKFLITLETAI
ncbi:MAG: NUDIX hydrolase [Candidatus Daviesbacteria bacterium]